MSLAEILGLILSGAAAGAVNAVAGGGTLLTFPTLLAFGTTPVVANATSTLALFLGTMFATIQDRDAPGQGFTHKRNDTVRISTADLGELVNRVRYCDEIAPWSFGTGALMRNLAERGLL